MPAQAHWREYLIEVAALGTFMVSAATLAVLIEHPSSPLRAFIAGPMTRRMLMGMAMGLTAASIIYSPWGRRSGAHMNPAVTLTFFRLGKIRGRDAIAYVTAQFAGGVAGITLASLVLARWIADPAVNYVVTAPGAFGYGVAFAAETGISFVMMLSVLSVSNQHRLAPFTGALVAVLVAAFITFEAPLSGMSMNPARTFGPDVIGGMWRGLWIYFLAPPLGMLAAAELFVRVRGRLAIRCAKLHHDDGPCIFDCGYRQVAAVRTSRFSLLRSCSGSTGHSARWRADDPVRTETHNPERGMEPEHELGTENRGRTTALGHRS